MTRGLRGLESKLWPVLCAVISAVACSRDPKGQSPSAASASAAPPAPTAAGAAPSAGSASPTAMPSPPPGFGKVREPADNPSSAAKVALGRKLFFDERLSLDGTRACYSCHLDEDGTGGHDPLAIGAKGKRLSRHSPTLWNVGYLPALYWDGRSNALEALSQAALAGAGMGNGKDGVAVKAAEIGALPEYRSAFAEVFGEQGATPETLSKALATFQRTIVCADTAWDRLQAGQADALDEVQQRGWELFTGKAGCKDCHTPPFFSDAYQSNTGAFHKTGVGVTGKERAEVDPGRGKVSGADNEWAAFKTPSLRGITRSAPYFHDGSVAKLEDAVRFMASGGVGNPQLDPRLTDRKLSDEEIASLVAFLGALECSERLKAL